MTITSKAMTPPNLRRHRLCIKCGHLNNGADNYWDRICICPEPLLVSGALLYEYGINEIRKGRGLEAIIIE